MSFQVSLRQAKDVQGPLFVMKPTISPPSPPARKTTTREPGPYQHPKGLGLEDTRAPTVAHHNTLDVPAKSGVFLRFMHCIAHLICKA